MNANLIFRNHGMSAGRMISSSKSFYRSEFPDHEVYFNANIFTLSEGKIWWGDLDLTIDRNSLQEIASDLGEDLFILREMDGRFENESLPQSEIISRATAKITK